MDDRLFFQQPITRSRLAGVQNARTGVFYELDVAGGQRGHAAEVLEEIEGGAFRRENRPGLAHHRDQDGTPADPAAVGNQDFNLQLGIHLGENARGELHTGNHALLADRDEGPRKPVFRDEKQRGDIAVSDVFGQGEIDQDGGVIVHLAPVEGVLPVVSNRLSRPRSRVPGWTSGFRSARIRHGESAGGTLGRRG